MMNTFMKIAAVAVLLTMITGCCNCRAFQKKNRMPLVATEWQLIQLGEQNITPEADKFNITFGADGRISGVGACNRLMGTYTTGEKNALKIGPLASTMMACPGLDREREFMQVVESATRYDMDGATLLLLEGDLLKAVFQAKAQETK